MQYRTIVTATALWSIAAVLAAAVPPAPALFVASDQCMACHNGLKTASGEDVSIASDWRASMMANSARDPYWQASLRRETLDHPGAAAVIENECAACHMPMTRFQAKTAGAMGQAFAHLPVTPAAAGPARLAADGVSCTLCHQIQAQGLGTPASFTAGFVIDTVTAAGQRQAFGPFAVDPGRTTLMQSASSFVPSQTSHLAQSELCATCHTLYTHALGGNGEDLDRLPEQVPYLEWLHSSFADVRSCQSCHMPEVAGEVPITGVMGLPRTKVSRHVFRGGNFFVPKLLELHRQELGTAALPAEFAAIAQQTAATLANTTAEISIGPPRHRGDSLQLTVSVGNLTGHKLPTAYPSRRAWIHLIVTDGNGATVFESGRLEPDGSIQGNDNDDEPSRFEPHHTTITRPDQVQVYEPILAGSDGAVTTGLLTAVRYAKDNRLLPDGFDKATADAGIAVHGAAAEDPDFEGGSDRVAFDLPLGGATGPFAVRARLYYQPIGFRWAHNLGRHDATETRRFVSYYSGQADASAMVLAEDSITVE